MGQWLVVTISRPTWTPVSFAAAVADLAAGRVSETHYLEAKGEIPGGDRGAGMLAKALCGLATDGGILVVGVAEDGHGKPTRASPVELKGLPERILSVAAACDPPVVLPPMTPLEDQANPGTGILLVHVPASMDAPHQAPNKIYYARDDRRSYPMGDAEVARLIQRRANRTEVIEELLDAVNAQHGHEMRGDRLVSWMGIVAQPLPRPSDPNLLLRYMGTEVRDWGQALLRDADQAGKRITALGPSLTDWVPPTGAMPSPMAARWERTATGIAAQVTGANGGHGTFQGVPRRERLEIDRDATIRLMANYVSTYEDSSRTLRWRDLLAHTVGTIELANLIGDQLGTQYGLNLGLDVHEIEDHFPDRKSVV